MKGLSTIERVILEALSNQSLTIREIQNETGLTSNVTFNLLQALIIRGLVGYQNSEYCINQNIPPSVIQTLNPDEARKFEALELITSIVEAPKNEEFKLKKVYLEGSDEKIFKSLLIQMESLINEASKKRKGSVKDCKVIFWAYDNYGSIIQRLVS